MKKSHKILIAALSCVLVLAIAATVSLCVMTYLKVNALEQEKTAAEEQQPQAGNPGEDDVVIGGQYVIRSTKVISDAYLSGDSSALSAKDSETLEMASKVLEEVTNASMSDYEKEQAVFLWMNKNIGSDADVTVLVRNDISTDNPHGVLSSRSAVCVGYATTFRLFMQMLDIPCMVVHDLSQIHSWDLVQIGGHWYHVDLYSAQHEKEPLQYLNRSDELQRSVGSSEWDVSAYPAADSLEDCYVYRNASALKDVYAIPAQVRTAIESHQPFASFLLPSDDDTQRLADQLMFSLQSRLMGSVEYQMLSIMYATAQEGDRCMAYIKIDDYSMDDDDDDDDIISDEEQERIEKAISDSFGDLTDLAYDYDDYFLE